MDPSSSEPQRDYYLESVLIMAGQSTMAPLKEHLEAMRDHADSEMIRQARKVYAVWESMLSGP